VGAAKKGEGDGLVFVDAERLERLIASNEHAANALNRLAQALEKSEAKRGKIKGPRARRIAADPVELPAHVRAVCDRAVARMKRET
jgi:hypothetical protein